MTSSNSEHSEDHIGDGVVSGAPFDQERTLEMRRKFEGLITELLAYERNDAAHALADVGVDQGLWANRWQRPIFMHPTTESPVFFDQKGMWFTDYLEENWSRMRAELDQVTDPDAQGFSAAGMDGMSVHGGGWRQMMLWDRGTRFEDACARFPVTAEVVEAIPEATVDGPGFVMLSWLYPGTWLAPHCGPTNSKSRTHLAITEAKGAFIRVADQERTWVDGHTFTFDDSYEHEVWHDGDTPRVVLIVDTPHPMLLDPGEVVREQRVNRGDEVRSFMESLGLKRVTRSGPEVSIEFDPSMVDFMQSYLETREIAEAMLRDGELHIR